jgi:two-component system response regulator YesN
VWREIRSGYGWLVKKPAAPKFGLPKQEAAEREREAYMYQVMLVDDSEVVLKEIRRLKLWERSTNFIINAEACNGAEALLKLTEAPVDLVITDIQMPKVNGLELLQKITDRGLAKIVALLSEYQKFSYVRQGMVLGAFDYIAKPVSEADLEKLLRRAAPYLAEKAAKEKYLHQLEVQLEDNVQSFYPEFEIKLLAEYAASGNLQAESLACSLVKILNGSLNELKTGFILQRAIAEIVAIVEQQHPWIGFFINLKLDRPLNYTNFQNIDRLGEAFVRLVRELAVTIDKLYLGNGNNLIVKQACNYVLRHVDTDMTIKSLAEALFLHRSYLSEVFKQQTGWRLNQYISMIKLERAKKLIGDGQLLGYQIAGKLGYKDVEYFSRIFKKYTGLPPSQYKESLVVGD